jgi:hypothetical protein
MHISCFYVARYLYELLSFYGIYKGTVDECADAPCQNGATCSSSVNKYSCQCFAGFKGKDCETSECC